MIPDMLSIYLDVMQRGSFAAVARLRGIDPSSVSRAISALEAHLGFRLFQRSTRLLAPTEAGEHYFRRIAPLAGDFERARLEAADLVNGSAGVLRVTVSHAFGDAVVAPLLATFHRQEPQIRLELFMSDQIIDLIAERIDLALRHRRPDDPDYVTARLASTRLRVVASPDWIARNGRPETPEALANHDCLLFPLPGYRDLWCFAAEGGLQIEVPVRGALALTSATAQCAAAGDGLGPALLSDWVTARDRAAGRLVDLFPTFRVSATGFDEAIWLVYPSRRYLPRKARVFADFLRAHLTAV
jgi:DNA-binding transcriptional LysR family regulator